MRIASVSRWLLTLALAVTATGAAAQAADYPSKPVTMVVPYGAGGGTDQLARLLAAELAKRLGQPMIVENVPGSGGVIGTQKVMGTTPDGYTLLLGSGSEYELMRISDPSAQIARWVPPAPIGLIGTQPMILMARPDLPVNNADELVELLRQKPASLSFGSAGVGTQLHLAGEMIQSTAKVEMRHVPYKSGAQLSADLIGGHIDLAMMAIPTVRPHLQSGRLKALGVTTPQRSPALPNVPSLDESRNIRGVEMRLWYGLFGPEGMPPAIVERVSRELGAVLAMPEVRAKLLEMSLTVADDTRPATLAALQRTELKKLLDVYQQRSAGARRP